MLLARVSCQEFYACSNAEQRSLKSTRQSASSGSLRLRSFRDSVGHEKFSVQLDVDCLRAYTRQAGQLHDVCSRQRKGAREYERTCGQVALEVVAWKQIYLLVSNGHFLASLEGFNFQLLVS